MRYNNEHQDYLIRIITVLRLLTIQRAVITTIENHPQRNEDFYEILQVPRGASLSIIRQAYLRLARTHHPDRGGDSAMFIRILNAYEALTQINSHHVMRYVTFNRSRVNALIMYENRSVNNDAARRFAEYIILASVRRAILSSTLTGFLVNHRFLQEEYHPRFVRTPRLFFSIPNEALLRTPLLFARIPNVSLLRSPTFRSHRNQTTFLYNENILDVPQENILMLDGFAFAFDELRDYAEHDLSKFYTNPHIKTGDREFSKTAKQILRNHQLLGSYARQLDSLLTEQIFRPRPFIERIDQIAFAGLPWQLNIMSDLMNDHIHGLINDLLLRPLDDRDVALPNPIINHEDETLEEADMGEDGLWLFRP